MSLPLTPEHLAQLKLFIDLCMTRPTMLNQPELSFVKTFIEHFGGKVPKDESPSQKSESANVSKEPETKPQPEPKVEPEPEPEPEEESEESDLELDMTGVIEPDTDAPQKMGNPTLQPTEEEIAESQAKRAEAVSAFVEKDYEKALELYTEAIVLNPQASLLYAKRGQIYLLLNKPNACIRDCNRALELNPDSAAAHKFRGRANHLLGNFEEAANDLRLACKFDFDEQADEWLRAVTPNARRIEEHKRKKERKVQEKLEREKQERIRKAQESAKAFQENTRTSQTDTTGTASGMPDFCKFLDDAEVLQALMDPEIAEFCKEISSNPASILKYQSNPKIMAFINKMAGKFGATGGGGFPGMPGGMPNFPSAEGGTQPTTEQSDVGLD
ncbi:putative protein FAM10A4 isoform X2 [Megachile rotundata]|uniref:putative protein FAM10A4 isoform X2 n=1 Tax=Megachile rotundata TaxID=143995 RepID=UPI00061523EC|nr:PREDICTED: putative protein FAM10A4 [Megachile rotundata]